MSWEAYLGLLEKIGTRYFLVAALAFFIYYVLLRNKLVERKIQQKFPGKADYVREIGYSVLTMLIFAFIVMVVLTHPMVRPHTRLYKDISDYGWIYFFAAFPVMLLLHDTYFYWTHRLMHHKRLFKYFHLVHHKSTNPSPWAAYSFHPLEAVVEAGILPVMVFLIPLQAWHIVIFFSFMILYNVYGHLGFELYPKWFSRHAIGKWINTSVNHNMHHQYFKGNYGLYFLFWDRMMGTIRKDYEDRFEAVPRARSTPSLKQHEQTIL